MTGDWGPRVRLRIEQFAPALGRTDANLGHVVRAQADAAAEDIGLLVTPELSMTGYDVRDAVHALAAAESDAPLRPLLTALAVQAIVYEVLFETVW